MKSIKLLSPDSAEGVEVDPLSGAASGWEAPKFPVLAPDRICRFKIVKSTKGPVKDHPEREVLTIQIKTEKDYTDKEGKTLRAGFSGYHRIGLTPSPGEDNGKRERTWKNIGEDLAMCLKACGMGDKAPKDLKDNPSLIEGQIVDMKVGVTPEKGGFPESNNFKFVLPG